MNKTRMGLPYDKLFFFQFRDKQRISQDKELIRQAIRYYALAFEGGQALLEPVVIPSEPFVIQAQ